MKADKPLSAILCSARQELTRQDKKPTHYRANQRYHRVDDQPHLHSEHSRMDVSVPATRRTPTECGQQEAFGAA